MTKIMTAAKGFFFREDAKYRTSKNKKKPPSYELDENFRIVVSEEDKQALAKAIVKKANEILDKRNHRA